MAAARMARAAVLNDVCFNYNIGLQQILAAGSKGLKVQPVHNSLSTGHTPATGVVASHVGVQIPPVQVSHFAVVSVQTLLEEQ